MFNPAQSAIEGVEDLLSRDLRAHPPANAGSEAYFGVRAEVPRRPRLVP